MSNIKKVKIADTTYDIDAKTVDGHSIGYIELTSDTTSLNDAQYAECLKDIAVIKSISATNTVSYYLKMAISNATITFSKKIEQISTYTSNYCSQFQDLIYIKRADKTVRFTSERIIDLYNKSQTDNLLATKQGVLTFNPTIPSGTTPTPLVNLKDGDNYYSFSSSGSNSDVEVMSQQEFDNATSGTTPSGGSPFLDLMYPIGSIYISSNSTSPASRFGGTWTRIKDRFILAVGDTYTTSGATSGSASHNHTLENGYAKIGYKTDEGTLAYREISSPNWENNVRVNASRNWDTTTIYNFATGLGGSTDNSSNMPPYITKYIWERIA